MAIMTLVLHSCTAVAASGIAGRGTAVAFCTKPLCGRRLRLTRRLGPPEEPEPTGRADVAAAVPDTAAWSSRTARRLVAFRCGGSLWAGKGCGANYYACVV